MKIEPENYCDKVEKVIPCLDSGLKNREYKDQDLMSERFLKNYGDISFLYIDDFSFDMVTKHIPTEFVFYPSQPVLKGLIHRAVQISDP